MKPHARQRRDQRLGAGTTKKSITPRDTPPSDRRRLLTAYADERDLELIFFDPPETFDGAIVGLVYGFNQEPAVLYDEACVLAAMVRSGMSHDDAEEFFQFNTIGAYLGDATPRFLTRLVEGDLDEPWICPDARPNATLRQRRKGPRVDEGSVRRQKRRARLLRVDEQREAGQREVAPARRDQDPARRQAVDGEGNLSADGRAGDREAVDRESAAPAAEAQPVARQGPDRRQQTLGGFVPFDFGKKGEHDTDDKGFGAKKAPPFVKKGFSKRKKKGRSAPAQKALRMGGGMHK